MRWQGARLLVGRQGGACLADNARQQNSNTAQADATMLQVALAHRPISGLCHGQANPAGCGRTPSPPPPPPQPVADQDVSMA
jgi:hypothetical protein